MNDVLVPRYLTEREAMVHRLHVQINAMFTTAQGQVTESEIVNLLNDTRITDPSWPIAPVNEHIHSIGESGRFLIAGLLYGFVDRHREILNNLE